MDLHPDIRDLLAELARAEVEYLVIGGYAVGFHSRPRFTKDIDLWVGEAPDNLDRTRAALIAFGAPTQAIEALQTSPPEDIVWMGAPPVRVDILRRIPGPEFLPAYARRVVAPWAGLQVPMIALDDLLAAKRAAGRDQDLLDVRALEFAGERI